MWRFKTLILILGFMSSIVHAMRFDIQSGTTKCITEDIKTNAMTVGKYIVVNPNEGYPMPDTHKITVRVTSLQRNNYHYGDHVDSGTFAFTAAEAGDYMACFWVPDQKDVMTVSVDFDWKSGVAAKDWSKVAKKGQVELFASLADGIKFWYPCHIALLHKLSNLCFMFVNHMYRNTIIIREEEMKQLNIATNSKMETYSFLSLLVCLSVAGLQLWHLKTFFERKKLL